MSNVHVYFGIENLALTNPQRGQLVAGLQALGVNNSSPQPAERNHYRVRLDNNAIIFEALFAESSIDISAIKQFLGNIFSVAVGTISHAVTSSAYGTVVTFSHNATDYIRMIAFGMNGGWPGWNDSRVAVLDYLADNAVEWEPEQ